MTNNIVCANYVNLDNEKRIGVFLIIYDEYFDKNTHGGHNVLAVKISSHVDVDCAYKIPIKIPVMNKDSVIIYSKIYTLSKKNIYRTIGEIPDNIKLELEDKIYQFFGNIYKQMRCNNDNKFNG